MQRKIHTFRAATMDEALDLVRRELGENAVVVDSKEIATRRLLPWPSTRQEIEVRAEDAPKRKTSKRPRHPGENPANIPRVIRTLAETLADRHVAQTSSLLGPMPAVPDLVDNVDSINDGAVDALNPILVPNTPTSINVPVATSEPESKLAEFSIPEYRRSLESLQAIMTQIERQSRPTGMTDIPSHLYQQYLKLIAADIDDELARGLIRELRQLSPTETLESPQSVTATLTALVEREMRCSPPIMPEPGRREIVTMVGPTGVGKTTTIAKLAGHFHLNEGLRIGMITVDTYRVGAIAQLRTYAEILNVPLLTASNSSELRTAIDDLDDVDVLLIDTAGRSPFDNTKLNELQDLLETTASNHVMLVMSLASGARSLSRIAEQFSNAKPTSVILTKLDESVGFGGLLSVAREIPLPVSYLTTGQDVPDEIEPAHPSRLARLILGRDELRPKNGQTQP